MLTADIVCPGPPLSNAAENKTIYIKLLNAVPAMTITLKLIFYEHL